MLEEAFSCRLGWGYEGMAIVLNWELVVHSRSSEF